MSRRVPGAGPVPRATAIDRHVGQRVREERLAAAMTQADLADLIDVTPQQIHKFERAENRITAGMLHKLAAALRVSIDSLFPAASDGAAPAEGKRQMLEMTRAFSAIRNPHNRKMAADMIRTLAAQEMTAP